MIHDTIGNNVRASTHERQQYDQIGGQTLHYFAIVAVVMIASSVWLGEGVHSIGRFCLVLGLGSALSLLARAQHLWMWLVFVICLVSCLAGWRSHVEWQNVGRTHAGDYNGLAVLKTDPQPIGRGVRVVLEINGQRFESWMYGSTARRMTSLVAGETINVKGTRQVTVSTNHRLQVRHIVGRFDVKVMSNLAIGAHISESRFELAANRIRSALGKGAHVLPGDQSSLFAGLVYGDDSQQPPEMVNRFRASGLAHLTAVSGQNVAFILTVAAPLLTRLRRWFRLTLTLLVLAWFAIMTRLEPSVIRAVTMAGISATVFAIGGRLKAWQVLAATCVGLLLIDPFLLWSVGWWLSIGGSSGLILLSSRIRSTLQSWGLNNHRWVLNWVVPSLAAQLGVLPVAVMVFGWPSAVAIPCNLLAVPVAGIVMLVGIPLALVSAVLPGAFASVIMWPLGVGVKWVDTVAALGQRFNLPIWLDIAVSLAPLLLVMRHRCDNLET